MSSPVIDADGHAVEDFQEFCNLLDPALLQLAPRFETDGAGAARLVSLEGRPWEPAFPFVPTEAMRLRQQRIGPAATEAAERVQVLDSEGIDLSVVFPSLGLYFGLYQDAEIAAAMCRAENRWLGAWCGQAPTRLAPMAVLPQQDPALSAIELVRAVEENGAIGGMVRPNPSAGRRVDVDDFDPLWRAAVALDVPIIFHEGWVGGGCPTLGMDRAGSYAAAHAMSHPFEAMSAILGVVQTGLLSRFPSLRLAFFEAGCGWAPWWAGRVSDHAALKPADFAAGIPDLSRRVWLSFEPTEMVADLVERHGWDKNICFASDFPHADATYPDAVRTVRAQGLEAQLERQVLGENALNLFGSRLTSRLASTSRPARRTRGDARKAFLLARGGGEAAHSHVSLLRHLEATSVLLRAWSAREALCDAGMFHSVYGTEAFANPTAMLSERTEVRDLIGTEAEALVWLFSRCSQQAIVDGAMSGGPLLDRVNGSVLPVSDAQQYDICELVVANWLEQRPRLDGAAQLSLLFASETLMPWLSPDAQSALKLARATADDDQALRRWITNSHRVITITVGNSTAPPIFEPARVLACSVATQAFVTIAKWLRGQCWNNVPTDHPGTRLALREPVPVGELIDWLGKTDVDALTSVDALELDGSSRATLAVGLFAAGEEVVIVPGDGRRLDGVYFGIEPLLLDMLGRALAPEASRVLECGAGAGLAAVLAARRSDVVASDVLHRASTHVALTRVLNPQLQARLHAVTADGAAGFVPAFFDLILTNPPLVAGSEAAGQPVYAYGGPTGTELPIRLLRETLSLLRPGGCLGMLTLDSTLHDGSRPLHKALLDLSDEYAWCSWVSPWRFQVPTSLPRLLANNRALLAGAEHVGIAVIRLGKGGEDTVRQRLHAATAALGGSGWTASLSERKGSELRA